MKTKKMIAMLIVAAALLSLVACQSDVKDKSSTENSNSIVTEKAAPTKLKNLMTETELSRIMLGELTLLDEDEPESTVKV